MHPSHQTRISDASSFDEICTLCGATDTRGSNLLNEPCPNAPRPITRQELLDWLANIVKMHEASQKSELGSFSGRLYIDKMPKAAKFIAECVKLTPEGTL